MEARRRTSCVCCIIRGGPELEANREPILDYCESDVDALARLLPAMWSRIDLPRALIRGRYMAAAAAMEWNGTPIDRPTLTLLREHWTGIQDELIRAIDADYGVFDGRSFRANRWAQFLVRHNVPWPTLESGSLDLASDTFREMASAYPVVAPIHELRHALSQLRLKILPSATMTAIAASCQRSARARLATNQAIPNLFLARALGCGS